MKVLNWIMLKCIHLDDPASSDVENSNISYIILYEQFKNYSVLLDLGHLVGLLINL